MNCSTMKISAAMLSAALLAGCATSYKAQPLPFKLPSQYPNATQVEGATVGAEAYIDPDKAGQAFGFDVRGAGLLPVQVVFDHRGTVPLMINPAQTFLVDDEGNLWPVLQDRFAYERVTKYAQTKHIFSEGAYSGFLGGVAGALVGAAVGVVSGEDVGKTAGQGAVVGAATGAVLGGTGGAITADEAKQRLMSDFQDKALQNKAVQPGNVAYGFIFFPGEAKSATILRLQLVEKVGKESGKAHSLELKLR
jgi:hypothetical protein